MTITRNVLLARARVDKRLPPLSMITVVQFKPRAQERLTVDEFAAQTAKLA